MRTPIRSLRKIGPATEAALNFAGILDAEILQEVGPDIAYTALISSGHASHFIGYYVLVMATIGSPLE